VRASQANRGMLWEQFLTGCHEAYAAQEVADIVKRDPAHRYIRALRNGEYVARGERKGEPDFSGGIVAPGPYPAAVAVKFDAKQVTSGKGRFGLDGIDLAQVHALDRAARVGTYTFIALELDGTRLVVPWASYRDADGRVWEGLGQRWWTWHRGTYTKQRAKAGTASITVEQALEVGARPMHRDGWLPTVRNLLREQLTTIAPEGASRTS
jgi:hypothetical protein